MLADHLQLTGQHQITTTQHKKLKKKKNRELINTVKYDKDIAKYIPGILELKSQGMLENIHTIEKVTHFSYTDMEELDFQILLTGNYYINPNGIHICFPIKLKKKRTSPLISMLI